jgi:CDP-glycerol glycerophosphotransferase
VAKLSVVVPVYNIQGYVEECLDSLARQNVADIEVIVVDDGSDDQTASRAERFAAGDPRFTVIRQANLGPGAARNAGIARATGDYLAFADGDDVIPRPAFELLIGSIEKTGSDFAIGNARRLTSAGTHQSGLHRRYTMRSRTKTHISRDPELLHDRVVWGRVFRAEFWRRHADRLTFPEGVLHEDIEPAIVAHYLAESVDVLGETVYLWRIRDAGVAESTTQRRTDVSVLRDRFAAVRAVNEFLAAHASRADRRAWDEIALGHDLKIFLDQVDVGDREFQERFLDHASGFLSEADPGAADVLPALQRLQWHLAGRRMLDELLEVRAFARAGDASKVVRSGAHWYGDYPFRGLLDIPDDVYRVDDEIRLRTHINDFTWYDGKLRVAASAGLRWLEPSGPRTPRMIALVRKDRRRVVPLPVRPRVRPAGGEPYRRGDDTTDADPAGFSFAIDPRRLRVRGEWVDGTWHVGVGVLSHGLFRKGLLANPDSGPAQTPPYRYVAEGVRVIPKISAAGALSVSVENVRAAVSACEVAGGELRLSGWLRGAASTAELVLWRPGNPDQLTYPVTLTRDGERTRFAASVRLADVHHADDRTRALPGQAHERDEGDWFGGLSLGGDDRVRLVMDEDANESGAVFGDREIRAIHSRYGYLTVTNRAVAPLVTDARWTSDGTLTITGDYHVPDDTEASLLISPMREAHDESVPLTVRGGRFTAVVPAAAMPAFGGVRPLPSGRWRLLARRAGDDQDRPVRVDHANLGMRSAVIAGDRGYTLTHYRYDLATLRVTSWLRPDERGSWWQDQLRTRAYPAARTRPIREAVLFESFNGRQFSDNPRAVHDEIVRRGLDLETLWVVDDAQAELPPSAKPVRRWSADWYEAIARSRYLVSNMFQPPWYERRPGQVVVETWHGTPLKKLGFDVDVPLRSLAVLGGLERTETAAAMWDLLVSPNAFTSSIMRSAFRYTGEIIESGYPRNDLLHQPGRDEAAERVRRRLGLPEGKRVVLYAPTWREDRAVSGGRYSLDLRLDLDAMRAELGGDQVLLVRTHQYVSGRISDAGGYVVDVSGYPDMAELYLVADVFITDYSSSMFDFAGTGKPILFFTYDLEEYRDRLRGLYFDLSAEAPGPLLRTSDEVIDALARIEDIREKYREPYDAFRSRFCALDDGGAAARVVDRMLELGAAARG